MVGGGGGGGASLGLDLSAMIQAAVVGLVLFSVAFIVVRRAASPYFIVDAAGFAASHDNHGRPDATALGAAAHGCSRCHHVGCKLVQYWCRQWYQDLA
ncbi:hypothetical protein ABZP36_006473 [Zizania latifolia]